MLPPKFENKQMHHYGTFKLNLTPALNIRNDIVKVQTFFFGSNKKNVQPYDSHNKNIFSFDIVTNLWHFYAYLSDCRNIHLYITDSQNQIYSCQLPIVLMSSSHILNKINKNIDYLFTNNSYLLNSQQKIRVFDEKRRVVGSAQVQMDLKFDQQINRLLHDACVVDMEDLLVIDEISPIPSAIQLDNFEQPKQQQEQIQSRMPPQMSPLLYNKVKQQRERLIIKKDSKPKQIVDIDEKPLQFDEQFDQDQKMIQDDIDRLIAQMQNRPYDSTRYLQSQVTTDKKENYNFANTSPLFTQTNSPLFTQTNSPLFTQTKSNYHDSIPPKYPSSSKTINSNNRISPIKNSPIYSYSVIPAQSDRVNYLMNKTTLTNRQFRRSTQKNHNLANSRQKIQMSTQKGTIRVKIHELMMQRYEQNLSLILKFYLNDDSDEYYTANGMKQGEIISFGSNMLINEKRQISLLRFVLIDSFDMKSVYAEGEFEMERLLSIKPTKGVFTVNMKSVSSNQRNYSNKKSKVVMVDQSRLVRVVPNMKTLRIELQYEEQIEIVQIYLNLSNFSKTIKKCRYKIPMTKQTIEFKISELQNGRHVNIFPHNQSSQTKVHDKIIVQLWSGDELIGINEVNLKQLHDTNQKIIMSSLQPIYLYEQTRNIQSLKGGNTNNNFYLQLYYGTISQVQSLLNRTYKKQARQQPIKQQVEVQQVLGVYVKQRKQQRQVQIQVSEKEVLGQLDMGERNISKKTWLGLQQQQDQPQQQQQGEVQQLENEFLNKSLQQKYLNKQAVFQKSYPSNNDQQTSNNDQQNFNKTQPSIVSSIKSKRLLRSLTEQYQDLVKQKLSDFDNEQSVKRLKIMVKDHLLYNFIEVDKLIAVLQQLGVDRNRTNALLQDIVGHSNGMLNINVLYDMIYGLMLDCCVKDKYLDDAQLGKYCLAQLYITHQKEGQELQIIIDENVEYDQAKRIYQRIGYRLTMRQFSQIEIYTKKMKDSYKIDEKWIRGSLLSKHNANQKQQQKKAEYKQQVINKIYQHAEWDYYDDFFISNINQPRPSQPQASVIMNKQNQTNYSFHNGQQSRTVVDYKQRQDTHNNSIVNQKPSIVETHISIKKAQSTHNHPNNPSYQSMKMSVEGLQNCIQTTECHLNITITDPKLKILYKMHQQYKIIILHRQQSSCNILVPINQQYLDGSVQLLSCERLVARCNFSMIADVRSVYTLKSVQQSQFCGLLYLCFRAQ